MGPQHRPPPGLFRRVRNYLKHDLREIIAPTSIPDPPGVSRPPPLTLQQKLQVRAGRAGVGGVSGGRWHPRRRLLTPVASVLQVTRDALRAYVDSWDSEKLQAELQRRGDAEAAEQAQGESLMAEFGERAAAAGGGRGCRAHCSVVGIRIPACIPHQHLPLCAAAPAAAAAKGGTAALKPFLANLYATRAAAYRDAATHFIRGYREGIEEANKDEAAEPPAGSLFDEPAAEEAAAAVPAAVAEAPAAAEAAPPGGLQQEEAAAKQRKRKAASAPSRQADGQPP